MRYEKELYHLDALDDAKAAEAMNGLGEGYRKVAVRLYADAAEKILKAVYLEICPKEYVKPDVMKSHQLDYLVRNLEDFGYNPSGALSKRIKDYADMHIEASYSSSIDRHDELSSPETLDEMREMFNALIVDLNLWRKGMK